MLTAIAIFTFLADAGAMVTLVTVKRTGTMALPIVSYLDRAALIRE